MLVILFCSYNKNLPAECVFYVNGVMCMSLLTFKTYKLKSLFSELKVGDNFALFYHNGALVDYFYVKSVGE